MKKAALVIHAEQRQQHLLSKTEQKQYFFLKESTAKAALLTKDK